MLTEKQLKLLSVFRKDIFKELTFKEIKETAKERSNNKMQKTLKRFETENIIKIKKVGRTNLYLLNFKNNKTLEYLGLTFLEYFPENMPVKALYKIQEAALKKAQLFSIIVFGSFAKGANKKNSDLDVAIFVQDEKTRKKITPGIESVKLQELTEIDYHIILNDEFLKMLEMEEENLGKQIFRHHFIFCNAINFYQIMIRGYENGFRS